jgi:hypothetical protein
MLLEDCVEVLATGRGPVIKTDHEQLQAAPERLRNNRRQRGDRSA